MASALLYRMAIGPKVCPHGLKARALLRQKGFAIEEHLLTSRDAVDAFKSEYDVSSTPQAFIEGTRIGGYDDLAAHFGQTKEKDGLSYRPVIALFCVAALMALALTWLVYDSLIVGQTLGWFIAIAMVLLGLQKLQDIDGFATMFLSYDLLAQRWVNYGRIYPFIETGAGLAMLAGVMTWVAAPLALLASGIGAISVFKAVYIDRRDLRCACVGGDSNVPLGFVSLTENLMMMAMAIWMMISTI
ncbi:MAG: MauE/DoxX family redox-associated membrane protein [Pseudomonadota bacterium]